MASTSSSSVEHSFKYDVFLSFRGEDTRKSFVDHLFHALQQRGIITYKDDVRIEKGEEISDQLIQAIQDSRFHIIVFSKNYASSSWCLEELIKIMECHKTNKQNAYPIFYDVEPTEVRNQTGPVGEAFTKHVKKEGAQRWRDALKEAADLSGWELKNTGDGHEVQFIQKVIDAISRKSNFNNFNFSDKLVGMKTRVEEVLSSLDFDCRDVQMIGIKGIGGGGKTTLATTIFHHISTRFEGKSFVANVREYSKGGSGLKDLQKQILHDVTKDKNIEVESVLDGENKIKRNLGSRKVLVVLDDVDHVSQLEALAGEPSWFKAGSIIIITTRDKHVLDAHHVKFIHDINLLSPAEAISLFSRHTFRSDSPSQGFEELSQKIIHYAAGLPLTIKVLGSFLCQRTKREWEKTIQRLEKIPLKETLEKLELSYNGLEDDYKEIFLDVVCMVKGEQRDKALVILESCGYDAEIGLTVLEEKCLISFSKYGCLDFHDHIEEMGMNIIRRFHSEEPSKHSRLWIKKEIEEILVDESGTEATRSLKLENTCLHPDIIMKGLRKMKKLRFLYVDFHEDYEEESNESCEQLPNSLKYLEWSRYPFEYLPKIFQANNLVNLVINHSNITQLWEGGETKVLNSLRYLDLSRSKKLRTLDLGQTPNLEKLYLGGCIELVELVIPTICRHLEILELNKSKLRKLDLEHTPNLEKLSLTDCEEFVEISIPNLCRKLETLELTRSTVHKLNLEQAPNLISLDLSENYELVALEMPDECLQLQFFSLNGSKVRKLDLEHTPKLMVLYLNDCEELVEISIPNLCQYLEILQLSGSKVRKLNLEHTPNLKELSLEECEEFVELVIPTLCRKLDTLHLISSKVRNLNLEQAPNLIILELRENHELVALEMPDECLELKLFFLNSSKVRKLNLEHTPNLVELYLKDCEEFVELVIPTLCRKLETLKLTGSKVRNLNLEQAPNLIRLDLRKNSKLVALEMPHECLQLQYFILNGSKVRKLWIFRAPRLNNNNNNIPSKIPRITMLFKAPRLSFLYVANSNNLQEIAIHEACLKQVEGDLDLSGWSRFEFEGPEKLILLCNLNIDFDSLSNFSSVIDIQSFRFSFSQKLPEELCQLKTLKRLKLTMGEIKHLPDNICMLSHLKCLELISCSRLEQLPKDLGTLECLEELIIKGCGELGAIPESICNMKSLKRLHLICCSGFEPKLPAELGRLECLEELNVQGTDLPYLPRSIYQLKGLLIVGSKLQLVSYGVTIFLSSENSESSAFGYIKDPPPVELQPRVGKKKALIRQGQSSTEED